MNVEKISPNVFAVKKATLKSVTLAVSLFAGSAFASTPSHNNDPLSLGEVSLSSLLTAGPKLAARSASADGREFTLKTQEVLLIERHQDKNAPSDQRRADVFIYDYSTNELIESLVDLKTSEVLKTSRKQNMQLPLNDNELKHVKHIVFDDEDERAIIEDEFRRITSRDLTSIDELNIKAFTFRADSLPNRVNEASKSCGIHRCAQLMLYTQENIVFEISPIVNLSEGVVTQRIGF